MVPKLFEPDEPLDESWLDQEPVDDSETTRTSPPLEVDIFRPGPCLDEIVVIGNGRQS